MSSAAVTEGIEPSSMGLTGPRSPLSFVTIISNLCELCWHGRIRTCIFLINHGDSSVELSHILRHTSTD